MKVPGGPSALRRSFAIRDYRLFVIGNLAYNLGLWTQKVALGWLTWELTHSTAWLGGVALAEAAPTWVFALFAGTLVDRIDYFRLLRLMQVASFTYAVVMAGLVLAGLMNIWILLVLVLVRGSVSAFNRPSRMTAVFSLVGRDLLASAVSINAVTFNVSRFAGPALGGALIVALGIGWTFIVVAALYLAFNIALLMIRTQGRSERRDDERRSMVTEMIDGLRYMALHPGIRVQMVVIILVASLVKPLTELLPGFAGKVFSMGPDGLAILLSAYGFGGMVGALWMASRGRGLVGMTTLCIGAIFVAGLFVLAFALSPLFWVSCGIIGVVGCAFIVLNVSNQTLIQSASDPAMRGRVISNYGLVNQGLPSIGALIVGGIAEHLGLRVPMAAAAGLLILGWLWLWRRRREQAEIMEIDPAADGAGEKGGPAGAGAAR